MSERNPIAYLRRVAIADAVAMPAGLRARPFDTRGGPNKRPNGLACPQTSKRRVLEDQRCSPRRVHTAVTH